MYLGIIFYCSQGLHMTSRDAKTWIRYNYWWQDSPTLMWVKMQQALIKMAKEKWSFVGVLMQKLSLFLQVLAQFSSSNSIDCDVISNVIFLQWSTTTISTYSPIEIHIKMFIYPFFCNCLYNSCTFFFKSWKQWISVLNPKHHTLQGTNSFWFPRKPLQPTSFLPTPPPGAWQPR